MTSTTYTIPVNTANETTVDTIVLTVWVAALTVRDIPRLHNLNISLIRGETTNIANAIRNANISNTVVMTFSFY